MPALKEHLHGVPGGSSSSGIGVDAKAGVSATSSERLLYQPNRRALLKLPQVRQRVPLSRATIYAMASENRFPRPIKLGGHASFWIEEEIDSWLQQQIDQQRPKAA